MISEEIGRHYIDLVYGVVKELNLDVRVEFVTMPRKFRE
jgi:hypothetical protein